MRYITNIAFFLLAAYAAVYGVTYAYLLHHLVNLVSAWLVTIHFSSGDFSLSFPDFNQILEGGGSEKENGERDVKKRP